MAADKPLPSRLRTGRRDALLNTVVLVTVLALAIIARFYHLDGQSLWSDEGNSAALAARSLAQIARDAANDIHPPLYYWLLHLWTRAAGLSEAGLRSLSAVLGVLLVWVTAELGRRLYGPATGLATAFVAGLSAFQVYYSQEARMYVLLALEAAVAGLLFTWWLHQEDQRLPPPGQPAPRRLRWLPFSGQLTVLAWVAGLYTHYAFPLMIALLTLLYLGWLLGTWRRGWVALRLARWGLLLLLSAGLYAPWLPVAVRQLTAWPRAAGLPEWPTALQTMLAILGLGPVVRDQLREPWIWALPALAAIGALPWPNQKRPLRWLGWLLPVLWVAAPIAMILGLGLYREAYLKFLLIAAPAWSLLVARGVLGPAEGLAAVSRRIFRWPMVIGVASAVWVVTTLAAVGGLSGLVQVRYHTDPTVARDDYRGIAQFIAATAAPTDAILLTAPGQSEVFNYYYRGKLPIYPLPATRPLDPRATLAALTELLTYNKVYAVFWATAEADPEGIIEHWMNDHGYKTLSQWRGNVRLAVYVMPERRPPDVVMDGLNVRLGNDIVLLGHRDWNLSLTAGQVTQVQLLWRADRTPERRYKVFLQLLDPRNQVIAQRDAEPSGDSRPTDTWSPGEIIVDNHGLLIPPGTPPGSYRRIAGLYDAVTGERLRLPNGEDCINLPPVTVMRAVAPPSLAALNMQNNQDFTFGGITLLGHDRYKRGFGHAPQTPLYPGDLLHLTFYWQANIQPRADWWFELTLNDGQGRNVAQLRAPLVGETYATTRWAKGEIVRGEHDLRLPAELRPGTYRLSLTLLPDDATPAGTAYLGTVKVQAKP